MDEVIHYSQNLLLTGRDLLPIVLLFVFFQLVVIRRPFVNPKRILSGSVFVLIGLTFFLSGLEDALFPLGRMMANQLTHPNFLSADGSADLSDWRSYGWMYLFAAAIGFATTVAEPSLIAVAFKAREASGGSINEWGLRIAVAIGVAVGITLGVHRIIVGTSLSLYIFVGYLIVILQTTMAPKAMIPLAYDSGGVTTSTVTVPIVAALGLGLSEAVPGRDPALDGFGLIAFASLFPIISVLAYAQLASYLNQRKINKEESALWNSK
jgi:hypothetical protein